MNLLPYDFWLKVMLISSIYIYNCAH